MAGICYVLPRLTASLLHGSGIAQLGLVAAVGVVLGGVAIVLLGYGDGREPFGFPWWWDLPTLGVLSLPALVVFPSLRHRQEPIIYPTLWFVAGGALWLPALYIIGNLPGVRSLATTLGDLVFSAGFINVWGIGLATGLIYYVVPKASGQPLFNRQLARVGFWSLMFGSIWMGPAQLVAGPAPEWLQGVAAVLGLALPVGAMANIVNLALTIGPEWMGIGRKPVLLSAMIGSGLAALGSIMIAIAGFRSAGVVVGFTPYWEGVIHLLLFGAAAFLFAALAWQAVPNLVGRSLHSASVAIRVVRRGALAAGATSLFLFLAGLAAGYGWAGTGFTRLLKPLGPGWVELSVLPSVLSLLAVLTALLGTWYSVRLALSIYQSLASGRPTIQEVLVEVEGPKDE
jgi:cytochrome c oxidase cbb3-type subunit 1